MIEIRVYFQEDGEQAPPIPNGTFFGEAQDTPPSMVREIAAVGIIPMPHKPPIGKVMHFPDNPHVITGFATRKEFLEAVAAAGLDAEFFADRLNHFPGEVHFVKIQPAFQPLPRYITDGKEG